MVIISVIVFVLLLSILVFVHELGHFAMAKWTGMAVEEFSIGFPPRLFSRKRGETLYSIGSIPFGGFVKIQGENPEAEEDPEQIKADPRSFENKKVRFRILVIIAGVTMNLLFAFVVLCVAFSIGFNSVSQDLTTVPGATLTESRVMVVGIEKGAPADLAGVKPGDLFKGITEPNSGQTTTITTIKGLQDYTASQRNIGIAELDLLIERDGVAKTIRTQLAKEGAALGVYIEPYNKVRVPWYQAPIVAGKEVGAITEVTFKALIDFFGRIFTKAQIASEVSGPIGIYKATAVATAMGFAQVVFLMVVLSINLALLNILPIPALDGGRLLFLVIEGVFRRKIIRAVWEHWINLGGFAAMMLLLLVLTVRDVFRLF